MQYTTPDAVVANIETCQELQDLNDISDAYLYDIKLSNDIDCDGIDFMPLGQSSEWSDSYFNGNFDGQGHKIKNLTINTDSYYTGSLKKGSKISVTGTEKDGELSATRIRLR